MRVLGIGEGLHDNGIAVIDDGEVLTAVNEERFSRRKFDADASRALDYCFSRTGITPESIDLVALAGLPLDQFGEKLQKDVENWIGIKGGGIRFSAFYHKLMRACWFKRVDSLLKKHGLSDKPAVQVEHHTAHAAGAYGASGWDPMLVFTLDGYGDGRSGGCFLCENGAIKSVDLLNITASAGNFYAAGTGILGFNPMRHGGKTTGLAAYGKRSPFYDLIVSTYKFTGKSLELDPDYYLPKAKTSGMKRFAFRAAYSFLRGGKEALFLKAVDHLLSADLTYHTKKNQKAAAGYSPPDIAFAFQKTLEESVCEYIDMHLRNLGAHKTGLAGGVFANVRLNQKISEIDNVESLYVFPHMGDGGLALGAAYAAWMQNLKKNNHPYEPSPLKNLFLGMEPEEDEIESVLKEYSHQLHIRKHEEIAPAIAQALYEKKIIARYDGKMEYGPRALGNRSILCHAGDASLNETLNARLKRTEFMPFAPATLWEASKDYYQMPEKDWRTAENMTVTFDVTERMKEECPAAVHVDGTARPQLLRKETNLSLYSIIDEYRKLSGIATVINTSFNMHEEPVVCTPEEAVKAFLQGAGDVLFLNRYEVNKR